MWYIEIETITVWYISSIFIHINYFSFCEICNSERYRVIVGYSPTSDQQVSAILWIDYTIHLLPWIIFSLIEYISYLPTLQGKHCVLRITIPMWKCAILKLRLLRFDLSHQYLYALHIFSFCEIYNSEQYRVIVGYITTPDWHVSAILYKYFYYCWINITYFCVTFFFFMLYFFTTQKHRTTVSSHYFFVPDKRFWTKCWF